MADSPLRYFPKGQQYKLFATLTLRADFTTLRAVKSVSRKQHVVWPPEQSSLYGMIGQRIRTIRGERGLTQEKLAELVKLTRTSMVNIEQGRQRLMLHTMVKIAEVLQIQPAELLANEITQEPKRKKHS